MLRTIHVKFAAQMAARNEAHAPGLGPMGIDGKAGLDIRGGEVPVSGRRTPRAAVLVPGEVAERAGRLPVDLVDDLLEVAADQRLEQLGEAGVEPDAIEYRLVVGRPLHHPDERLT